MPLAMANVLQVPICILTPHYLTPLISVLPRQHADSLQPIMLAYDNTGPEHYNVLVPKKQQSELLSTKPVCNESNAGTTKSSNLFCRCGINNRIKTPQKRSYKSRCRCITINSECSSWCKCLGKCGDVQCKKNITSSNKSSKKNRSPWKRGKHPIVSTPTKGFKKAARTETGSLNELECLVIFAIVKYVMTKGLNYTSEEISQLYNEIVEFITQHESLMLLPISSHSQRELDNAITRIQKNHQRDN